MLGSTPGSGRGRGYALSDIARGPSAVSAQGSLISGGGRGYNTRVQRQSLADSICSELWSTADRSATPLREDCGITKAFQALQDDRSSPQLVSRERGIRIVAAEAIENIWQTAENEMQMVVEAGGGLQEKDADERYKALLEKALAAQLKLKSACAEMRICRAELMMHIGVGGRALLSAPCWEACGHMNQGTGKGGGKGRSCVDCGFGGKVYFDKGWGKWYCAQCWFDGYLEWPDTSLFLEPRIVLNRYEVSPDDVLGQGGFSIVRRGRDLETGEIVAVKAYSSMESLDPTDPAYEEDKEFYLQKFKHEVATFQRLHAEQDVKAQIQDLQRMGTSKRSSWYVPENLDSPGSPGGMLEMFSCLPDPSMLFVRLEAFSIDADGVPGPSPNGECCVVLELAEYTLDEFLKRRDALGELLTVAEVQEIFKQLAEVLAMLHSKKFVHCDLKPMNVMHFACGRWKLIDMDGMVMTGGTASLYDVFYTPLYSAPEFADLTLGEDDIFNVSRLFDVWSLGAMLVELVTLYPWLQDKYNEMSEGGEDFMVWLAEPNKEMPLPPVLWEFDLRLADLCSQMLEQNIELRASMVEVLLHPFVTDSEMATSAMSEKRMNYMQAATNFKAMEEQAGLRQSFDGRVRHSGAGTCVKKRISVLFAETPPPRKRSSNKFKLETYASEGSAFTDVGGSDGQDVIELKSIPRRHSDDSSIDPDVSQKSVKSQTSPSVDPTETTTACNPDETRTSSCLDETPTRMLTTSVTSIAENSALSVPSESKLVLPREFPTQATNMEAIEGQWRNGALAGSTQNAGSSGWRGIHAQAKASQERTAIIYRTLRERECIANGLEAIFWAATEAEASVWREASIFPCLRLGSMSSDRCAELEGHVERAARGLQAAQSELWEARDLEKLVNEREGFCTQIPPRMT